jgi:hypothetical protein
MANKSRTSTQSKTPGRTLKEKRAAKKAKEAAKTEARKAWDK